MDAEGELAVQDTRTVVSLQPWSVKTKQTTDCLGCLSYGAAMRARRRQASAERQFERSGGQSCLSGHGPGAVGAVPGGPVSLFLTTGANVGDGSTTPGGSGSSVIRGFSYIM